MKEKEMPLVSVVVPCYNHEKYVKETIESIVNQTYKNIELIVIDDGSKDTSAKVIQELADKYKFTFIHRPNKGLSATLNEGVKLSKGKYFCACASDDYFALDKIEKQVLFMQEHPQFAISYGNIIKFSENSYEEKTKVKNPKSGWIFEDIIMGDTVLPAVTVMLYTNVIKELGGYDENLWIEDWDMWLRVSDKYQVGYLDEYLAFYRRHDTNISKQAIKMYEAQKKILNKWQENKNFNRYLAKWKLNWFNSLARNHKIEARKNIKNNLKVMFTKKYLKAFIKYLFFRENKCVE